MWTSLIKNLPWRSLLLAVVINIFLIGLYYLGYKSGHENARREGDVAISQLQAAFDKYKAGQAALESAALRAWAQRYQAQVTAGYQAEAGYLEQIAQIEKQNRQLQEQIDDVTQRWTDEKGKSHPISCVFTRGFVRRYNAAFGADDAGDPGADTAARTGAGAASGHIQAAQGGLRDSGVSQRDVLASIIDNATQCRAWRSQINGLLDEREGLQK